MMLTTVKREWICDACNKKEVVVNEFEYLQKVTEESLNKLFPSGWFAPYLSIPKKSSKYSLFCSECMATLKGDTFEQMISSYAILLNKNRPILTVDAVVTDNDKFLLIKRKNPPYGWALPGGLMDKGETLSQAVARELQEETGLIADNKYIEIISMFSDPNRDPRFHAVSAAFHITKYSGVAKAADDAKELGWFSYEEIKNMEIAFDHKKIIEMTQDRYPLL